MTFDAALTSHVPGKLASGFCDAAVVVSAAAVMSFSLISLRLVGIIAVMLSRISDVLIVTMSIENDGLA